jgi:hypothetical protein
MISQTHPMNTNPAPLTLHLAEDNLEYRLNGETVHDGMALEVFDGGEWIWGLYSWEYEPHRPPRLLYRAGRHQNVLEIRDDTPCRWGARERLYA